MSADLVKRQHFVPRTYLKHFGVSEDSKEYFVHVLPSSSKNKEEISSKNIKNVAMEKHLYTLPGETIAEKMAIEKFYHNEFENHYDSIYQMLTNPEINEVNEKEKELIISTVVTMYYRTTKLLNGKKDFMRQTFDQLFNLCQQTGKDYFIFDGVKMSIAGKTLDEFTNEFNKKNQARMILTQLMVAFRLIEIRLNDSICVVRIDDEDMEFVTSDNPVTASNIGNNHITPFDPSNVLSLPLDSKHILKLIPKSSEGLDNRIYRRVLKSPLSGFEKLTSNYSQMQNSERFMFGSKSALESYLATKQESERPLNQSETAKDVYPKLKDLGL